MRMTDAQMYARVLAGDATFNGRFFTGVLTTGIYCLPSCKARKPHRENVRFFPTCEAARHAGLRPCRKCHPDDFARGADPVLDAIEALVEEIRRSPVRFSDVKDVVRRSGFGTTRVFELLRQFYHATPADLLVEARIEASKELLKRPETALADAAALVGFESLSVFHDHFRRLNGVTPGTYRTLGATHRFDLELPSDYPVDHLKRAIGRDAGSLTERVTGETVHISLRLRGQPALLSMHVSGSRLEVEVVGASALDAHPAVVAITGLQQNAPAFSRLAMRLGLARLVEGRPGLRLTQTPAVFDGVVWAILGQQINLPFAFILRQRLTVLAGDRLSEQFYSPPTPARIAALSVADLLPLQFSRKKAEYLLNIARKIAAHEVDVESLRAASAARAERTLLAEPGFGPWSVNYILMRALGFADCVPLGDTGLTSGLKALFSLQERPDADATRRLMAVFTPFRSLATAHLWHYNRESP